MPENPGLFGQEYTKQIHDAAIYFLMVYAELRLWAVKHQLRAASSSAIIPRPRNTPPSIRSLLM
jgi:hypothetical protein